MQPLLLHSFDDGERTTKHGIFGGLAFSCRVRSLMQPLLLHSFDDGERTTKHGIFGGLRCWGFGKEDLD
ncbi:hypothetical protein H0901_22205 [Microcystis aeruginosa BLCCF158]|uniref:Uncharacterized protein n=1 Tax=Microcystis aeruginosa BLCC-F158 TaxID=2755316 RepID=A0A841V6P1_MICAE|nr:hypothetical protein [Microcystis aeruginosa]MBC1197888.1 hypothetical protein [Microcystis aeruginosa BLCC-F158]